MTTLRGWSGPMGVLVAFAAVLVGIGAAGPAYAEGPGPYQFGNVIYTTPVGKDWKRGHHEGHVSIYNFDLEPSIVIEVHLGEKTDQAIDAWLANRMKAVLDEDDHVKKTMPPTRRTLGKYQLAMGAQLLGRDEMQMHAAIRVGGRLEHIFASSRVQEEDSINAFTKTFTAFLSSLRFVNEGAKPLVGEPAPGDLEGIYYGATLGYGIGGVETDHSFYFFSKSGRFYEGVPKGRSLKTLDPVKAFFEEPSDCGNYEVRGNKLVLRYASGDRDELDFERDGEGLKIEGVHHQRVEPPTDGLRFEGMFSTIHFTSFTPGSGVVGGAGGGGHFTFHKDGTYLSDRWSTAFGNFESAAGDHLGGFSVGKNKDEKRGTYAVKDGLITMTEPDGKAIVRSILFPADTMLFLDNGLYLDRSKTSE